jgi:hypothetical protein
MVWNEDNIEIFIKEYKDHFDKCDPSTYHESKFINKLIKKFKKFISIVPYLIRVFIVTIIVFVVSIWVWNSYIRKDRHEVTLKQKIENIITFKK